MRYSAEKRPFWHPPTAIIIILIGAVFALYLHQLDGQSLWRDEILSIGRANQSFSQIISNINIVTGVESPDLHPPFYFLLLSIWRRLVGETVFAYRYLSLLCGLLALPLFYACGKRIWGETSGIWAAIFAGLSSFYLWYAQETRMYALLVVESLLVIYTLWPLLLPAPQKRAYVYFGLVIGVSIYTHYTGIFLLAFSLFAIGASQIWAHRQQLHLTPRFLLAGGLFLVALLLLSIPLLPHVMELATAKGFIAFGRPSLWWLLASGVSTFTQGSTNPPEIPWWQMLPFLILFLVGAFSWGTRHRWQAMLISLGGFAGVLLLFYAASFIQANYSNPRHLMVLSPFLFLLMGHGLVTLDRHGRVTAVLVGGAVCILSAFSIYQTITAPPVLRDDVRALAAYIEARAKPGDTVLWHNAVMSLVYDYYQPGLPTAVLPRYAQNDQAEVLAELAAWQVRSERIWFVRDPAPPFFDESLVYDALRENRISSDGAIFPASWAFLSVELMQPVSEISQLPADAMPAALPVGDYTVRGVAVEPVAATDGGTWATLFWQLDGERATEPPKVCLQLAEMAGLQWSESCTFLQLPDIITPSEGALLAHDLWLEVPPGLAPVPYELTLVGGEETETVGTVKVTRPSPAAVRSPLITYENGLNLTEVNWFDYEFHTGFWILGDLVWQVPPHPDEKLIFHTRLVDWLGQPLAETRASIAPTDFPEPDWQAGDLIRTRLALPVPYRIDGPYRLQIGVSDENSGSPINPQTWLPGQSWTTLDILTIKDWPLNKTVPADSIPVTDKVLLGDEALELAAYHLAREGNLLTITLYWRSLRELHKNYGTFIHVGLPGEAPLAQTAVVNLERPLPSWREGEVIAQTFSLPLPENLGDDTAVLQIGMYDPDDPNRRLPILANGLPAAQGSYILSPIPVE